MSNQLLSEQFRIAAKEYVKLDAVARQLEESKTTVLNQRIKELGDVPFAHAERDVKAREDWQLYIEAMVNARTAANVCKFQLEWLRMRHSEQMSTEASMRAEMKL